MSRGIAVPYCAGSVMDGDEYSFEHGPEPVVDLTKIKHYNSKEEAAEAVDEAEKKVESMEDQIHFKMTENTLKWKEMSKEMNEMKDELMKCKIEALVAKGEALGKKMVSVIFTLSHCCSACMVNNKMGKYLSRDHSTARNQCILNPKKQSKHDPRYSFESESVDPMRNVVVVFVKEEEDENAN